MIEIMGSFVVGAVSSWLVTHMYYRKALRDSRDIFMSSRLDKCNDFDLAFLVALLCTRRQIPRYACINVEYIDKKGVASLFASSMTTMVGSVEHRVGQCILHHSSNVVDEDQATITLTDRGLECAKFIQRAKFPSASFTVIDDSPEQRTGQFTQEHKRDPRRRTAHVKSRTEL